MGETGAFDDGRGGGGGWRVAYAYGTETRREGGREVGTIEVAPQNISPASSSPSCSPNPSLSPHSITHLPLHQVPPCTYPPLHQVHHQSPSSLPFTVSEPSSLYLIPKSHRHLREEQQWSCEEQRRACERKSLLVEITKLKLRIQALRHGIQILKGDLGEVANVATLLQVSQERNLIPERGLSASLMLLEEREKKTAVEEKSKRLFLFFFEPKMHEISVRFDSMSLP